MGMTSDGRPLEYPDNPLTRAMAGPASSSQSLSPTAAPEWHFGAAPQTPSVRSGALGKLTSSEEEEELDKKLAALLLSPPPGPAAGEVTVRYTTPTPQPRVRMNFNNIQRIDLEREVIVVDDTEFPLAPDDVKQLRLMCIDCVLNAVVHGLRDMLSQSGIEPAHVAGMLKEDVLGRSATPATLPEGHPVPGEGESPQDSVESNE
jgi:hypothetical protein